MKKSDTISFSTKPFIMYLVPYFYSGFMESGVILIQTIYRPMVEIVVLPIDYVSKSLIKCVNGVYSLIFTETMPFSCNDQ